MPDLHVLPRFGDSLTYVYAEHARVDRQEHSIGLWDENGLTEVPVAAVRVLMLGPGTSITHAAIKVLADNNCLVVWCGEELVRFYAHGIGGSHGAARLIHQARMVSNPETRAQVARQMYAKRFPAPISADLTIEQLRGMEGQRVRETYRRLSAETGVPWQGRSYDRGQWAQADPVNRAISAANSCLYGLCHAAILSAGYSPALGFIHTGKQLSFVYDIADLYKTQISLPVAFAAARQELPQLERHVRLAMRDAFREFKLLGRIVPDIRELLADETPDEEVEAYDEDPARPGRLWAPDDPERGQGVA